MRLVDIENLVNGTGDAAYALDQNGFIVAWNKAATDFFGLEKESAIGQACHKITQGIDDCGRSCSSSCTILKCASNHQPLKSYDIQFKVKDKQQWCNVSVLIVGDFKSTKPYTVHIIRLADMQKRFELLIRDFVVNETSLPKVNVSEILVNKNSPSRATDLTKREIEILTHLAKGKTTAAIAEQLFISRTTANNHIQHIMKKLSAHSRLEAVRRAEQAGLI